MKFRKQYCIVARPICYDLFSLKDLAEKSHVVECAFDNENECLAFMDRIFEEYERANYLLSIEVYYERNEER